MNNLHSGKISSKSDLLQRILCLVISGIFTFTSTIGATHVESSFWSQRQEHISRSTIKSDASPILDLSSGVKGILHELPDGSTVNFPANSGTVVETFQSASANPLVIHIQDVHNHPDAQLNEAFLIQSLLESSNFLPSLRGAERRSNLKDDDTQLLICIEGAKGIVPTRSLASLPDAEAKKEVAYSYLREGKINGEEYVALTQPANKVIIYGVEDWNIYNANFAAREKARQISPAALAQVDNLLKQIKRAEAGKYSMELREFVSKRRAYHGQELDLATYLKFLTEAQGRVVAGFSLRSVDRRLKPATTTLRGEGRGEGEIVVPNIARALEISVFESKLDTDNLELSLKALIGKLSEKLTKNEIESLLHKSIALRRGGLSQSAYYTELFKLAKASNVFVPVLLEDYREYQTLYSQLSHEKLMDEMEILEQGITNKLAVTDEARELLKYTEYVELLKDFWSLELTPKQWGKYKAGRQNRTLLVGLPDPKPVEEYYKLAEIRDEVLARNTLAAVKEYGVKRSVLVAGGFHSDGMTAWFKSRGLPYVVIQPTLQRPQNVPQHIKIEFTNDVGAAIKEAKNKLQALKASFRELASLLSPKTQDELNVAMGAMGMVMTENGGAIKTGTGVSSGVIPLQDGTNLPITVVKTSENVMTIAAGESAASRLADRSHISAILAHVLVNLGIKQTWDYLAKAISSINAIQRMNKLPSFWLKGFKNQAGIKFRVRLTPASAKNTSVGLNPIEPANNKSVFNALASAVGYGLLAMVVGGAIGGHFDIGNANVFSLFGYTFNALGMMAGLAPAGMFGFQAARIGWAISNAKAGHERGPGVLIPEFESAVDLPEPFFLNGNRIAARLPNGQIAVYKPSMKQLSLTEQYWYYYHEKVHGFFGRLPGQEALVVLFDFVTWIPAIWKAHKAQVITLKKANKLLNAYEPAIIGDERNFYTDLGDVEKYIVGEQTRLEVKLKELEDTLVQRTKEHWKNKKETFNIPSKLKNARQRLEKTYDLRAKFLNLGLVSNHTHTNEAADDGLYTPAALVEHARQNNITVLYVTGHNTMEGGVKAAEYIKAKGYLMDIRIAAEIDAPFEDEPYDEGKPGTGPYGYMHWIVIAQDDEVAINKMRDLTREIDSRLEPNLKRLFTRIFFLADKEKFSALTANIMQGQWQNWGKFLQGKGLIENGYSVEDVQKVMYGWFKELAEFASQYPEKTPAANGRRMLNKLNILGKWSGQVWGDEEETPRSVPMRELMTILYPDGVFEQETGIKAMRAEEIAQKYTDLGALVIVSHPQFEIGVIKTVTEGQVINHVVSMVRSGTIKGMGGGWWKQGWEYTEKLAERISSEAGQEVFQVGSNPDFHGTGDDIQRARNFGQGWALEGLKPDRARHFKDGEFLSRQYVEKVKKLLSEFYDITDAEVRDGLRNDIFNLARIAAATDPYGKAPRKLIQQIHKTLIKDYKDKRSVYETIISNPIVMLTTAVSLIAKFVLTLVGGSFLVGMVAQQEPGEITSIKTAIGLLDNIVPVKIGDERNLYQMLGNVERFIVSEQRRVEGEIAQLEDELINAPTKEEHSRLATVLVAKRVELKDIYTARAKFIKFGLATMHTHTNDDDGKYSAEDLVEHARANNITVLYITGHNTMAGYLKARKYIEEKGYLMDIRPGVEIDAPFEDTPYKEGMKNSGPYAYMHFLVIGPNDEETINKMQELTKAIDSRLEVNLEEYFKYVYLLADGNYFNEAVQVAPQERWLKWGKDLASKGLVQNGEDLNEVKAAMLKWFQEVVEFVGQEKNIDKTPLGKNKRWLGKLNVLGNWTDQISTWGKNASAIRRPMRDLMTMLFSDGMIEEKTNVQAMRAKEVAQRFTDLGAIVIVAHPDFEVNTLRSITEEQLLSKVIGMVNAGTIKGIGGGWWQKGWEFTKNMVETIKKATGKVIRLIGSNPDFHGGNDNIQRAIPGKNDDPWGLDELTPDRDSHFEDGKFLSQRYIARAKELLRIDNPQKPKANLPEILRLVRLALATDPYGQTPRDLMTEIYNLDVSAAKFLKIEGTSEQQELARESSAMSPESLPEAENKISSTGLFKTAASFMGVSILVGVFAYLFGQDTTVVKLAVPALVALSFGIRNIAQKVGMAEKGQFTRPEPEQIRKVVAELSQRFPGVVIKEAEEGKGITYEQGGDLYVNYESLAGLSPVVRQLIYSHEAMHLTNIPVVRSEFAAYLRLAIGLPVEIVKHHLKVMVSQTHARLGSDVKAGLETLVALLSFRGRAYPAVDYKTVDINPDNLGIAEKVKQAAPSIDIEASKGVTGRLGEISTVLPQMVSSHLAQIGLEVKGVAVNPVSLVRHYKSREVPTLSAQVIVSGPSDMKPLLVNMDTQQLNSQLSFKFGEIKLTLLSDEFMKAHVNDSSRNRELFAHIHSMVPVSGASFTNEEKGKLYGGAYVAQARKLYNEAKRTLNIATGKGMAARVADVVNTLNELDFVLQAATGVDGIGIAANLKSLVHKAMVTGKWAPSERMLDELKENMASAGKAIEAASRYVKLQNKLEGRVKKIMSLSAGLEDKDDRNKQERSGPGAFAVDSPVGFAWTAPWVEGMIMQNIVPQIVAEAKKGNLAIIPIVTDGDGEPLVFKTDEMYLVDDRTKKVITAISDALRASAETETATEVRTRLLAVSNQFVLVPEENVKEANGLLNQEKLHDILLHMPALRTLGLSSEFPLHMYSPAMPGKGQRWVDIKKSYLHMLLMVTPLTIMDVGQHSKEAIEIYKMLAEQA